MKQAMFYEKLARNNVKCTLCPRNCIIQPGCKGFCRARQNINGKLFSTVYSKPCSLAIDPIEKKPLFHFAPGSRCLSIATPGCNLACMHCQNWEISQTESMNAKELFPQEIIAIAEKNKLPGIAWTYTEPTIFFEYFYDTAVLCKKQKKNIYNIWVSNGFTAQQAIKKARHLIDAVNIDFKGDDNFYKTMCNAWLSAVQEALIAYKKLKIPMEITNLIIPNKNDSKKTLTEMCEWIFNEIGDIPLHFSRYFPQHKMKEQPTPLQALLNAKNIAEKTGFSYVYVGNIQGREDTICPQCKNTLIIRSTGKIEIMAVKKGNNWTCHVCNNKIPLHGMQFLDL
jgi:pyruvate formate lyase activating enzyme